MPVLWFQETEKEEARIERTRREYTRFFKAKTSLSSDGVKALLLFRPDLAPFQPHKQDPQAFVDHFNPVRDNLGLWDITVDYTTEVSEEQESNPLAVPAKIELGSVERKRIRVLDANGKPVLNTAGDLLDDPPPEIDESDLVFSVEKNVPIRLPAWILEYRNAVNSDVVRVRGLPCDPGTLKLKGLRIGDEEEQNKVAFCKLSFELHHREDGWTELIPNRGYYEKVPKTQSTSGSKTADWTRKEVLINGEPAKEPQMLDAKGRRIERPTLENIVLLEFDFAPKRPFNLLPLK